MKQSRENLLKKIHEHSQYSSEALEICLRDEDDNIIPNYQELRGDVDWLEQNGYIYQPIAITMHYILGLTDKGEQYVRSLTEEAPTAHVELTLSAEEHERLDKKDSEEKAEKQRDRKYQVFSSILSAVVGSLLTLLIEHFKSILEFISSLLS